MRLVSDHARTAGLAEDADEFEAAERLRLERVERRAMPAAFTGTAVMVVTAIATDRLWLLRPSALGAMGFVISYLLVRRGAVRAAALGFVVTALALVTNSGVAGPGLRDPAVLAYPVVIIFAGMTLKPRSYAIALAFVASSAAFVGFNDVYGWVTTPGVTSSPMIEGITTAVILTATAYAVWLLAASTSGSLSTAHSEIKRRRAAEYELKTLSLHDPLTGVFNRRFFDAEMGRLEPSRHYPVSVIVADVDGLKSINDERGHAVGDAALIQAASVLSSVVRVEDVLARIGGDEFAILLPDTDAASAEEARRRIERRLQEQQVGESGLRVSLSVGAATSIGDALNTTLARADSDMYSRKAERV